MKTIKIPFVPQKELPSERPVARIANPFLFIEGEKVCHSICIDRIRAISFNDEFAFIEFKHSESGDIIPKLEVKFKDENSKHALIKQLGALSPI